VHLLDEFSGSGGLCVPASTVFGGRVASEKKHGRPDAGCRRQTDPERVEDGVGHGVRSVAGEQQIDGQLRNALAKQRGGD